MIVMHFLTSMHPRLSECVLSTDTLISFDRSVGGTIIDANVRRHIYDCLMRRRAGWRRLTELSSTRSRGMERLIVED